MRKHTRWFPHELKPARVGVYEIRHSSWIPRVRYAFWDGACWGNASCEIDGALDMGGFGYQDKEWRGLSRNTFNKKSSKS